VGIICDDWTFIELPLTQGKKAKKVSVSGFDFVRNRWVRGKPKDDFIELVYENGKYEIDIDNLKTFSKYGYCWDDMCIHVKTGRTITTPKDVLAFVGQDFFALHWPDKWVITGFENLKCLHFVEPKDKEFALGTSGLGVLFSEKKAREAMVFQLGTFGLEPLGFVRFANERKLRKFETFVVEKKLISKVNEIGKKSVVIVADLNINPWARRVRQ
jgi:hypothetical protein